MKEKLQNSKITMATLKSFIKKSEKLYVKTKSSFDGMEDGVRQCHDQSFKEVQKDRAIGFDGVYCVGSSRDYFTYYEDDKYFGVEVYNCCGCGYLVADK